MGDPRGLRWYNGCNSWGMASVLKRLFPILISFILGLPIIAAGQTQAMNPADDATSSQGTSQTADGAPGTAKQPTFQRSRTFNKDMRWLKNTDSAAKVRSLQMSIGGSDSGGGQGVYDIKSGLHFADIYTSDELARMNLLANPQATVFSKFPTCTKTAVTDLWDTYRWEMQEAARIVRSYEPYLKPFFGAFSEALDINQYRYLTPFHLRQLRDAVGPMKQNQIQIAIYRDGVTFYQSQVMALLPQKERVWLHIKEILRFAGTTNGIHVTNAEIQEALRDLYHQDMKAFLNSTYFLKMRLPSFDDRFQDSVKREEIVKLLQSTDLSDEEQAFWQNEIDAIDSGATSPPPGVAFTEPLGVGVRPGISPPVLWGHIPEWAIELGENPRLYKASRISQDGHSGLIPVITWESNNDAGKLHLYNVITGERYFSLRDCQAKK